MKPELDYAAVLQYLKARQSQVLTEEYTPALIRQIRCQNQLCRDVPEAQKQERAEKFQRADMKVKMLEIAMQVLREEFGPRSQGNEEEV